MSDHTAASYLACIDETVAALKESGETISDGLMVVCTLDGLPRDYSSFVDIVNQRNPPYKYEELKIALLNHEDRLKGSLDTESVMFMKPRPSEMNRSSTGAKAKNYKKQSRPIGTCFRCNEPGHFASGCTKAKEGKKTFSKSRPSYQKRCNFHNSRTHNTDECKVTSTKKHDRPNFVKSINAEI